ncbi:sugar transferase [Candidatus Bipolaricaulota bacterium]
MTSWGRLTKRVLDLAVSLLALAALALPLLLCAAMVALEDRGPVLFRQRRVGKNGILFRVWKLRTMTEMRTDPRTPDRLRADDPRITRVGRFLRRTGIDELPQLLNVLSGAMSLVGPRPTLSYQVREYTDYERRRLEVRPGITSLAVASGRNALPWKKRIELDVWYVDHWSLLLDLRILLQTVWHVLVKQEGVHGDDGANDVFFDAV